MEVLGKVAETGEAGRCVLDVCDGGPAPTASG